LKRYPFLDQPELEISGFKAHAGGGADEPFISEIGGLLPMALLEVGGTPFVEILIAKARRCGFRRFVLLTGHKSERVQAFLADREMERRFDGRVELSIEPTPFGTGGALIHALPLLVDEFLLLDGDTWFDFKCRDLVARARRDRATAALSLRYIGRIQAVVATPIVFTYANNSSRASAGVFQPSVFLGLALRAAATAAISSALWMLKSVPCRDLAVLRRWRPVCCRAWLAGAPCAAMTTTAFVRSSVEHVFAVQKDRMDQFIRTIGIARATTKIGMANIVYNIKRLLVLQRTVAASA
jgi:hypothetical protein